MKIIFLIIVTLISIENRKAPDIDKESEKSVVLKGTVSFKNLSIYADPYIIHNTENGKAYLYTFFYDDDFGYLKIMDSDNIEVFSKTIDRRGMSRFLCFPDGKYFYFFSDKLFRININSLEIDSVNLNRKDYLSVNLLKCKDCKYLAAKSSQGLDLYDFNSMEKINSFNTKFGQADEVKIMSGIIIFRNTENELIGYDVLNKSIKWRLNTGRVDAKLWGIKIGRFNNYIAAYQLVKNLDKQFIYVTTADGDLYKLDPLSGKVLIKKGRFRGDDNNSGLITDLQSADLNGDGVKDLIGPSVDDNIYCLNGKDLSIIWKFDTGYKIQMPLTLSDINQDGFADIFGINDKMKLTVLNGKTGACISELRIDENKNQAEPVVGYLYGNNFPEIIVKANKKEIRIYALKDY